MMNTPICDFVRGYSAKNTLRLHMPGHKGLGPLGFEKLDLTEIDGADSLFEADGIIHESERNASSLFGSPTFYSTEGSSLCIRAMLYLACLHAKEEGRRPLVFAGRNAHKTFLSAAALIGFDVEWLYPAQESSYLSCTVDAHSLENAFHGAQEAPAAVYLTSPDYLGNICDIRQIAEVCHRHGALLIVDNAHGSYLKFLPQSMHPIDLGADICCDSAHKTLPVLTGGAYLHVSGKCPHLADMAKDALALFGSTSPSYLILQSLDAANAYLEGHRIRIDRFLLHMLACKESLIKNGYALLEQEPFKITVDAKKYGYTGQELADILRKGNIECEFADPDFLVLMCTPETGAEGLKVLQKALCAIEKREPVMIAPPQFTRPCRSLSPREAALSPSEKLPVNKCLGRVLALATVGCPPAVPIVVSGEKIDKSAIACFAYYGIESCCVVKDVSK